MNAACRSPLINIVLNRCLSNKCQKGVQNWQRSWHRDELRSTPCASHKRLLICKVGMQNKSHIKCHIWKTSNTLRCLTMDSTSSMDATIDCAYRLSGCSTRLLYWCHTQRSWQRRQSWIRRFEKEPERMITVVFCLLGLASHDVTVGQLGGRWRRCFFCFSFSFSNNTRLHCALIWHFHVKTVIMQHCVVMLRKQCWCSFPLYILILKKHLFFLNTNGSKFTACFWWKGPAAF